MALSIQTGGDTVLVRITGELDHHMAASVRRQTDDAIDSTSPNIVIFDFSKVSFMDSSGIGLIMGRYGKMQNIGGTLAVRDPSDRVERIFKLAGLERIIELEKGEKNNEN
jgi:stage II sporulation protein AA (anti-sigma F factor antagonist)